MSKSSSKTIGILGAGQLGRMLALSGYPLELDFHLFDTSGSPSAGLGDISVDESHCEKSETLQNFLEKVDVVTYEFEHLPLNLCEFIDDKGMLRPGSRSIKICQNRALEKQLFDQLGIPTPAYRIINSLEELEQAVSELGTPVVTKTTTDGYDGKGQFVIRSPDQCKQAWSEIGDRELIVEQFINFKRELSIIAVRSAKDEIKIYPLAENDHDEGILRFSTAPAPQTSEEAEHQAFAYIKDLIHEMGHIGVLTLELFETEDGLMANEMAPRVHNSGHWSIEGAHTSQFENHVRAVADLPLGDTSAEKLTCMINIIGQKGDVNAIMALPYAKLHLYGKSERAGRKLGHVTVQADTYDELAWRVKNVVSFLPGSPEFSGY